MTSSKHNWKQYQQEQLPGAGPLKLTGDTDKHDMLEIKYTKSPKWTGIHSFLKTFKIYRNGKKLNIVRFLCDLIPIDSINIKANWEYTILYIQLVISWKQQDISYKNHATP
jgi:hypothetical protein